MVDLVEKQHKSALSGWPMIVGWIAMLIFVGHSITHMVGAGDTWVAMACGRHFTNHGVDTVEPFSANSHHAGPTPQGMREYAKQLRKSAREEERMADPMVFKLARASKGKPVSRGSKLKASLMRWWADRVENYENWPGWFKSFVKWIHPTGWVNQNWLTHVIFYNVTHESAENTNWKTAYFDGLVIWKFLLYLVAIVCVYYSARMLGVHAALAAVMACFAIFIGRSFLDVRPAGFSNTLVAMLFLVFVLTTYKHHLFIWFIVPMLIFWCNVHGGYIYAFIVLVPFIGIHFLLLLPKKWRISLYCVGALGLLFVRLRSYSNTHFVPSEADAAFMSLIGLAVVLVVFGFLITRYKDKIVSIGTRALIHVIAASGVAFVCTIFFNPFRLTNLTHTFIVSISKHAEMWRTVNEWHPAFEWSNPVGTGVPFLIMLHALLGVGVIWLFNLGGRWYIERKGQPDEKTIVIFEHIFRSMITILAAWIAALSFSFVNPSFAGFFSVLGFMLLIIVSVEVSVYLLPIAGVYCVLILLLTSHVKGFGGTYIFTFLLLPAYVLVSLAAMKRKGTEIFKKQPQNIGVAVAVSLITFFVMMNIGQVKNESVFSFGKTKEYKLTWGKSNPINFEPQEDAGIAKAFKSFISHNRPWKPIFERRESLVDYTYLFGYLLAANLLAICIWIGAYLSTLTRGKGSEKTETAQTADSEVHQVITCGFEHPRFDIALFAISLVTIMMAIKSRRFIPIAGYVVCPFIGQLFENGMKLAGSIYNYRRFGKFALLPIPNKVSRTLLIVGIVLTVFFGWWWGSKFNRIYLEPFANDPNPKLATVFMRMTASNAKPFFACEFIRKNELSGRMFNYWTEGGFIAYGQDPNDQTGRTPLQLYMDGRAQAAYEPSAYQRWMLIMAGGPNVREAMVAGRRPTQREFTQSGQWIDKLFKSENVWVVMMPAGQFTSSFVRALETQQNWQPVFINNKQKIWVDTDNTRGREIMDGIVFEGRPAEGTVFPSDFSEKLTKAYHLVRRQENFESVKTGFALAVEAFNLRPSQYPVLEILQCSRYAPLRPKVAEFCDKVVADFDENKQQYRNENGFLNKLFAALRCADYMRAIYAKTDKAKSQEYIDKLRQYGKIKDEVAENARW